MQNERPTSNAQRPTPKLGLFFGGRWMLDDVRLGEEIKKLMSSGYHPNRNRNLNHNLWGTD
jgi:hypothetical protein